QSKKGEKMSNGDIVTYIQHQYGLTVSTSTASRINSTRHEKINKDVVNPAAKRHRSTSHPAFELALREFVVNYQHRTVLTDDLLVEKAKLLAEGLGIPNTLQFSHGWLARFKERNGLRQRLLEGEAASADNAAIANSMPMLHEKCNSYPLERLYNMDETGLF